MENRGGARPGAGRKTKGEQKTMCFRLSKDVADIIEKKANDLGMTRTEVVEMAVRKALCQ